MQTWFVPNAALHWLELVMVLVKAVILGAILLEDIKLLLLNVEEIDKVLIALARVLLPS
jgi:hypothetical protein